MWARAVVRQQMCACVYGEGASSPHITTFNSFAIVLVCACFSCTRYKWCDMATWRDRERHSSRVRKSSYTQQRRRRQMTLTTNYYFRKMGRIIILENKWYSNDTKHYVERRTDSNHFTWNWKSSYHESFLKWETEEMIKVYFQYYSELFSKALTSNMYYFPSSSKERW